MLIVVKGNALQAMNSASEHGVIGASVYVTTGYSTTLEAKTDLSGEAINQWLDEEPGAVGYLLFCMTESI